MGSLIIQQIRAASFFRKPWLYQEDQIQNLVRMTKKQFFNLVLTCVGAKHRASELNTFAECFLLLFKLCHNSSFRQISTLFGLNSHQVAANAFYRQLVHQYLTNCNIPLIIQNDQPNDAELDKLYRTCYQRTPLFYKNLVKDFEDRSGRNRTPLILNIDGTYINIQGSGDINRTAKIHVLCPKIRTCS